MRVIYSVYIHVASELNVYSIDGSRIVLST